MLNSPLIEFNGWPGILPGRTAADIVRADAEVRALHEARLRAQSIPLPTPAPEAKIMPTEEEAWAACTVPDAPSPTIEAAHQPSAPESELEPGPPRPSHPPAWPPNNNPDEGRERVKPPDLDTRHDPDRVPSKEELRDCLTAFYPELLKFLYRRFGHDSDLAHDVAAEACLQAIRFINSGDAALHPNRKGWLILAADRIGLEIKRREQRRPLASLPEEDTIPSPTTACSDLPETTILQDALGRLPEQQRTLIDAAFFSGKSIPEAAKAVGMPVSTFCRKLALARTALRKIVEIIARNH